MGTPKARHFGYALNDRYVQVALPNVITIGKITKHVFIPKREILDCLTFGAYDVRNSTKAVVEPANE
jgi:hypothetical protein